MDGSLNIDPVPGADRGLGRPSTAAATSRDGRVAEQAEAAAAQRTPASKPSAKIGASGGHVSSKPASYCFTTASLPLTGS